MLLWGPLGSPLLGAHVFVHSNTALDTCYDVWLTCLGIVREEHPPRGTRPGAADVMLWTREPLRLAGVQYPSFRWARGTSVAVSMCVVVETLAAPPGKGPRVGCGGQGTCVARVHWRQLYGGHHEIHPLAKTVSTCVAARDALWVPAIALGARLETVIWKEAHV